MVIVTPTKPCNNHSLDHVYCEYDNNASPEPPWAVEKQGGQLILEAFYQNVTPKMLT
jgi:hypothetical protein